MRMLSFCLSFLLCLATRPAFADEPAIPIGLMATLSGESATPGVNCAEGLEAARVLFAPGNRVGRHLVRFVRADSKGLSAVAVSEFQRLENVEKVAAVINQRSQTTMAISPLARAAGLALIGVAGQQDFLTYNPLALRFWPSAENEVEKIVDLIARSKDERIAILTAEDEYALSVREYLGRKLGSKLVYDVAVNPSEHDFLAFAAAIRRQRPDVVISNLTVPQNGMFVKKSCARSVNGRGLSETSGPRCLTS